MDALKIECVVKHAKDYNVGGAPRTGPQQDMVEFFKKHLVGAK